MNIQAVVVVDGWVVMVVLLLNSAGAGVKCRRAHALQKWQVTEDEVFIAVVSGGGEGGGG